MFQFKELKRSGDINSFITCTVGCTSAL